MTSTRRILPQRRYCETVDMPFGNDRWRVTVGYYGDHMTPGEVFVTGQKSGSDADAMARDNSILLSFCLQHGVPIETIKNALTRNRDGSPSTVIGAVADRLAEASAPTQQHRPDGAGGD